MSDSKEIPLGFTNSQGCTEWPTNFNVHITQTTLNEQLQRSHLGEWTEIPPDIMPWSTSSVTLPDVIRFTGEKNHPYITLVPLHPTSSTTFLSQKRKSKLENTERPVKMFITEETMVAQLKSMHISNKYVTHQSENENMDTETASDTSEEVIPTLTLSKEVQSLTTLDALLPETILTNLRKPSQALVLWKQPVNETGDKRLKQLSETSNQKMTSRMTLPITIP